MRLEQELERPQPGRDSAFVHPGQLAVRAHRGDDVKPRRAGAGQPGSEPGAGRDGAVRQVAPGRDRLQRRRPAAVRKPDRRRPGVTRSIGQAQPVHRRLGHEGRVEAERADQEAPARSTADRHTRRRDRLLPRRPGACHRRRNRGVRLHAGGPERRPGPARPRWRDHARRLLQGLHGTGAERSPAGLRLADSGVVDAPAPPRPRASHGWRRYGATRPRSARAPRA